MLLNEDQRLRARFDLLPPDAYIPPPSHASTGDFDGDEDVDVFLVYGADDTPVEFDRLRRNRLLLWEEDGFVEKSSVGALTADGNGLDTAAGDLNHDGHLDLVLVQATDPSAGSRRVLVADSSAFRATPMRNRLGSISSVKNRLQVMPPTMAVARPL